MNLKEKARLLTGENRMSTKEFSQYNISSVNMADGPSGVRKKGDNPIKGGDIAFPTGSAQAATWNPELIKEMGHQFALNCIIRDVNMILAPGVNIQRNPLCGRNYEYFSEDPYLSGEIGAAYISGIQEYGVGTSLKHFAANHQENCRGVINAEIAERPLRELYLAVFEYIIKKSAPTSVMCAYNKLNGIYCSENKYLLTEILREEWGYDGMVISDWGAVHNVAKAIKAGLDLIMPERSKIIEEVMTALDNNEITEADIDRAVTNVLNLKKNIDALPKTDKIFDRDVAHEFATDVEREAIVLLKNDDNILPIDTKKYKKIGVLGYFADKPNVYTNLESSGTVIVDDSMIDSPLKYIKECAGDCEIMYEPLYDRYGGTLQFENLLDIQKVARECDMLIMFAGYPPYWEIEGEDRENLELPPFMVRLIEECTRFCPETVIVTQTGSSYAPFIRKVTPKAIVQMWYGGEGAGKAIAEVLFGKTNPSGRLPMTFMKEMRDEFSICFDGKYLDYTDGLFVGYRYYDKYPDKVWFPFGYGLSYTTFKYSDIDVKTSDNLTATVSFKVTNTGNMAGKEVCQLYVKPLEASVVRPEKELKGFSKIHLEPGETKEVVLKLDERAFSYYNVNLKKWHEESGKYEILVAASAQDVRLSEIFEVVNPDDYTINRRIWSDAGRKEMIG